MERDAVDGDLLDCPWVPVCISVSQLLAKTWFGDTAYRILLTDLHSVWEEEMDTRAIQDRAQELNRRLRAPVHAFFSHMCEVAHPCLSGRVEDGGAPQFSLNHHGGDINLKLKSELAGVPFYWEFRCTPAPVALVCSQLVRPLLLMSRLLQRQVGQLGALLARKDTELQDYRDNGAVLSRGRLYVHRNKNTLIKHNIHTCSSRWCVCFAERLQTELFEEQSYRENFLTQTVPQVCARQGGLGFDSELQELYSAVTFYGNTNARKRKISERHAPEEDQSTTEDRDPNHAASGTQPPGEEVNHGLDQVNHGLDQVNHGLDQGDKRQTGWGVRARTTDSERPNEEQTTVPMAAAADRPPRDPRRRKLRGFLDDLRTSSAPNTMETACDYVPNDTVKSSALCREWGVFWDAVYEHYHHLTCFSSTHLLICPFFIIIIFLFNN
ncbi:non-homologous end-joining factor 1 isoform X3 [Salmo salar]|uniref:Non-homologous end-joining factor 1 n=1 Tax=Salmo salar TaxID=8030 RepID=A0ABM3D5S4_SALSA|nr:non-homologous end-joining factor 1-like isoform X3 [Salmo salar]